MWDDTPEFPNLSLGAEFFLNLIPKVNMAVLNM